MSAARSRARNAAATTFAVRAARSGDEPEAADRDDVGSRVDRRHDVARERGDRLPRQPLRARGKHVTRHEQLLDRRQLTLGIGRGGDGRVLVEHHRRLGAVGLRESERHQQHEPGHDHHDRRRSRASSGGARWRSGRRRSAPRAVAPACGAAQRCRSACAARSCAHLQENLVQGSWLTARPSWRATHAEPVRAFAGRRSRRLWAPPARPGGTAHGCGRSRSHRRRRRGSRRWPPPRRPRLRRRGSAPGRARSRRRSTRAGGIDERAGSDDAISALQKTIIAVNPTAPAGAGGTASPKRRRTTRRRAGSAEAPALR